MLAILVFTLRLVGMTQASAIQDSQIRRTAGGLSLRFLPVHMQESQHMFSVINWSEENFDQIAKAGKSSTMRIEQPCPGNEKRPPFGDHCDQF